MDAETDLGVLGVDAIYIASWITMAATPTPRGSFLKSSPSFSWLRR